MKKLPLFDRITIDLQARQSGGLLRRTPGPGADWPVDCATNSYLNLQNNPDVIDAARQLMQDLLSGNCSSRIIASRSPLFEQLEKELADWKKCEAVLLFNTGYAANLGVLQALATRHTAIFCDRLNHASIYDGIALSGARLVRYHHNDMDELRRHLAASQAIEKIIVSDTVFSMDGDCAPLPQLCQLAQDYQALLVVDEAHATGVLGPTLSGLVEAQGCESGVDVRIGTLSKAFAGMGGFCASSALIRDFLVNHSRSQIYSTALPHATLAWNLSALRAIRFDPAPGAHLLRLASVFRCQLNDAGFDTMNSCTQIVPVLVGANEAATALSSHLARHGIRAPAIRPPTVPLGTARVRFSLHCGLNKQQLSEVVACCRVWKAST